MQETPVQFLGSGRSAEGIGYPTPVFSGFPGDSAGEEAACNEVDLGSIPGLGRSPGEGQGCPLQYSGLGNSMDMGSRRVRRLSNFHFHFGASLVAEMVKSHPAMLRSLPEMWEPRLQLQSSVGKQSTCGAGEPRWIPGSGRSSGEERGYPFQYSWASWWLSW